MKNLNHKKILPWIAFFVIGIIFLFSTGEPTDGQTVSFDPPVALSPEQGFAWFPDIVSDPTGTLHVVWSSATLENDVVIYTKSTDGENWREINDIMAFPMIAGGSEATRPSLLVSPSGWLHMAFRGERVYYARAAAGGAGNVAAWSTPELMSTSQIGYFSKLAINEAGQLFFFYTENKPDLGCTICYHLKMRTSKDDGQTWSEPIDISLLNTGSAKPQILIDKDQNLHVVWESGAGGGLGQLSDPTIVKYSSSYDNGLTWSEPYQFKVKTPVEQMLKNITIGQDKKGNLITVWWGIPTDDIFYSISEDHGISWSDPAIIPDVIGPWAVYNSRLDDYSVANDSSGNLHLVMVGRKRLDVQGQSLSVFDLVWDGAAWAPPVAVYTVEGDVPEWPRIAISSGNQINVVWFVRNKENVFASSSGVPEYRIWFAKGYSAAPFKQPSAIPSVESSQTATPKATNAAVTQAPSETATSLPVLLPEEKRTPSDVTYSETDYLKLIGITIIPTAVLLLGVMIYLYIRKRLM